MSSKIDVGRHGCSFYRKKMDRDTPDAKRYKKADKAKDKKDRNGTFSKKHIRIADALKAKNPKK